MTAPAKPLTPHMQRMWDLHTEGKTREQIAAEMDIGINNVSKTLTIIRKKLGKEKTPADSRIENKDPEKVELLLEALSHPGITKEDAVKLAGYQSLQYVNSKMLARLINVYQAPLLEKRRMKREELKAILEDQLYRSARFLTDEKLAEASARDLAVAQAAWTEKLQLLNGLPTQIVSDLERKKLHELLPALIEEGKRRGITIEGEAKLVPAESNATAQ